MTINIRGRRRHQYNFEDGLKIKGKDIEQLIAESRCETPLPSGVNNVTVVNLRGDDVTKNFTLSSVPALPSLLDVYIGGQYQQKNTYMLSGSALIFSEAPPTPLEDEDNIEVVIYQASSYQLGETDAQLVQYKAVNADSVLRKVQDKLDEYVTAKDLGYEHDVVSFLYNVIGKPGQKFKALGIAVVGDHDVIEYYWDGTSNVANDGFNIIQPSLNVGNGRWIRTEKYTRLPEILNYAALRAYTGPRTDFYVQGHTSKLDGGAGIFRVDASDTTSADNGGTVLVDASGRRWKREVSGAVNVLWFGAVGDGVADDTAAIQAAINAALASQNARTVYFPPGLYSISAPLLFRNQMSLKGDVAGLGTGPSLTSVATRGVTIRASVDLNDYMLKSDILGTSNPWKYGVQIENINFISAASGTSYNNTSAIDYGLAGQTSYIKNCTFNGFTRAIKTGRTTLGFQSNLMLLFESLTFYSCLFGIDFDRSDISAQITNCQCDNVITMYRFFQCTGQFHVNINTGHYENANASATEVILADGCNGSSIRVQNIDMNAALAASDFALVRLVNSAANKVRVSVENAVSAQSSNCVLKDDIDSVSWTFLELGVWSVRLHHNTVTVLNSGDGALRFQKAANFASSVGISDGTNSGSATVTAALFERVGRCVRVRMQLTNIVTTGMTAGNQIFITGLPFVASSALRQVGVALALNGFSAAPTVAYVTAGDNRIRLCQANATNISVSNITSGNNTLYVTLDYFVS